SSDRDARRPGPASSRVTSKALANQPMKLTAAFGVRSLPARYPYKRDEEVRQLTDLETVSA
ncbi:MAG: hypothetical protein AABZ83_04660, partial [candidate division NC10 bacterium]